MARPAPLYQVPGRVSEIDRTPRTYATAQSGRDSYLARPQPVHDTSSDARSWSRQTEDALDAYNRLNEKHETDIDQTVRTGYDLSIGRDGIFEKSHETRGKVGVEVTEYRLDSGISDVRILEPNQKPEKSASSYYATYIEAAELENDTEETQGAAQRPPKNHRMTKLIVKEDIDFFTAVLEGHDPPTATTETRAFVRDETETHRQSQDIKEREAEARRREEAQAAKADTDFFMMLMQKG